MNNKSWGETCQRGYGSQVNARYSAMSSERQKACIGSSHAVVAVQLHLMPARLLLLLLLTPLMEARSFALMRLPLPTPAHALHAQSRCQLTGFGDMREKEKFFEIANVRIY
uniref:Uncharacterized protein n=1 Tax=Oryza nivara TaxID=4536 RepID=A0A0E0FJD6_ORYNI